MLGKYISQCGLFIDAELNFLGATSNGLIDDDGIVEIKCPSSAKNMTPEEAILAKKFTFWKVTKTGEIGSVNENHNFYFQIQGQLLITHRKYCEFALWTPKGLKLQHIEKNDQLWNEKMKMKLEMFYMNCMLPELIDPRHTRTMVIRDPAYILQAQKLENKNKFISKIFIYLIHYLFYYFIFVIINFI
uniref:YqaJ viral recombinase domain-containing protein n=1 Tax=Clastoptera arizonana TaxID=38151 RepID=A0A1B6E7F7_9HEMI